MSRSSATRALLMAGLALAATAAPGTARQGPSAHDTAIRAARAASNAAIAAHDISGIARHWATDVHIVTSTSAQGTGHAVNGQRMAQQFARRPDTIYVRTPALVDVLAAWGVASERGEWTGRWTEPDGVVQVSGTYMAQWRTVNGTWLIQAEVFVPTACTGSTYCAAHP
jgi:ketosteroid isomerase-like protein